MIRVIKNRDIDREKWDRCIEKSYSGLPYAFSWFLDVVSPTWEALVLDDYRAIMPLPIKRKFTLKYVVQPVWTQQLGIFSSEKIDSKMLHEFVRKIPFLCYLIKLNFTNPIGKKLPNLVLTDLKNASAKFSANVKRNIRKALKANIWVGAIVDKFGSDFVRIFVDFYLKYDPFASQLQREILPQLCSVANKHGVAHFYCATNEYNQIIAALMTLETNHRIIYFAPVSSEMGKTSYAMFLLIDWLISINAESGKILDFEGSQIDNVARFYSSFGAELQPYFQISRCRLQWLRNLLHR